MSNADLTADLNNLQVAELAQIEPASDIQTPVDPTVPRQLSQADLTSAPRQSSQQDLTSAPRQSSQSDLLSSPGPAYVSSSKLATGSNSGSRADLAAPKKSTGSRHELQYDAEEVTAAAPPTLQNVKPVAGPRLMDRSWETVQKKTFTKWVNTQLAKGKISPVTSMVEGVSLETYFSDF